MIAWIITILLFLAAFYALFSALRHRDWIAFLIASGFILSLILLKLSPIALFYHSVALVVLSASALIVTVLSSNSMARLHKLLVAVIAVPYILICSFKVLHLQGVELISYGLFASVLAFIYFSLDRRVWDQYWAHTLFITLSAVLLLM